MGVHCAIKDIYVWGASDKLEMCKRLWIEILREITQYGWQWCFDTKPKGKKRKWVLFSTKPNQFPFSIFSWKPNQKQTTLFFQYQN